MYDTHSINLFSNALALQGYLLSLDVDVHKYHKMFTTLPFHNEKLLETPIKLRTSRCNLVSIDSIYIANRN